MEPHGTPQIATYTNGTTKTLYRYKAIVVGGIWMPYGAKCSMEYKFEAEDNEHAKERVDTEAGDFSSVDDFALYVWGKLCQHCHNQGWLLVKDFTPEGEMAYCDLIP